MYTMSCPWRVLGIPTHAILAGSDSDLLSCNTNNETSRHSHDRANVTPSQSNHHVSLRERLAAAHYCRAQEKSGARTYSR
jgi:hypothetical protein